MERFYERKVPHGIITVNKEHFILISDLWVMIDHSLRFISKGQET